MEGEARQPELRPRDLRYIVAKILTILSMVTYKFSESVRTSFIKPKSHSARSLLEVQIDGQLVRMAPVVVITRSILFPSIKQARIMPKSRAVHSLLSVNPQHEDKVANTGKRDRGSG